MLEAGAEGIVDPASASAGETDPAWTPPNDIEGGFKTRIGASFVDEFVAGHSPTDVLRELVQNEFDAGGERMWVQFGETALSISGTGRPIDDKGWTRLDVVIGTGRIAGSPGQEVIEPKQNGIGSKNFGLRSLFLFGDRIFVRSAGRMAVQDLPLLGTQLRGDPSSLRAPGVHIHVPYRSAPFEILEPFTAAREGTSFDRMAGALLATVLKLAEPAPERGLREITLSSVRTGRTLHWSQDVKTDRCSVADVTATRRRGRLTDKRVGTLPASSRYAELEFTRTVPIPAKHTAKAFPSYYRVGEATLRISVSLPILRNKIDLSQPGRFYYPLQAGNSSTGCVVGVSAPFDLVADRSTLRDGEWNDWLATEAAGFVATLLTRDWVERFGPDAYLALRPTSAAEPSPFSERVAHQLRTEACWPTAQRRTFAKAGDLVILERPEFGGLLSAGRYLEPAFADRPAIVEMVRGYGAKPFTRNSMIRLRCADSDASKLETKPLDEANLHYSDYENILNKPTRQLEFARAIAALRRSLSNENRADLRSTPSTLAADGTLHPARELMVVSEDLWDVCPAAPATRLHRSLVGDKTLATLCRPFELGRWARDVADRAARGAATDAEKRALYERLVGGEVGLNAVTLGTIRRSPVLRDHRGAWASAEDMVILPSLQARLLGGAVHMPAVRWAKDGKLIASLRIRQKLAAEDLIAFAAQVERQPEKAEAFEALLQAHIGLLSSRTISALKHSPFLATRAGGLAAPADLHLDNPVNRICAGGDERIVGGRRAPLYERLGCRKRPSSAVMLKALEEMQGAGRAPPSPETFYTTLVLALQADRRDLDDLEAEPILWVGGAFRAPEDVLVGPRVPSFFGRAVPYVRGPVQLAEAFEALGAPTLPKERHWAELFSWAHAATEEGQPAHALVRQALREAYQRRQPSGLPEALSDTTRCLLARDQRLYSKADVAANRYVEDDFPALARALAEVDPAMGFAEVSEFDRPFFRAVGLRRLSALAKSPRLTAGPEGKAPPWFKPMHEKGVLGLLARDDFRRAMDLLIYAYERENDDFRALPTLDLHGRLTALESIQFVTGVVRAYDVGGRTVEVVTDSGALSDRIAIRPPRTKFEFEQSWTYALAELAGAIRVPDARRLSLALLPLLMCETSADILAYLERQGLRPANWADIEEPLTPEEPSKIESSPEAQALKGMVEDLFARAQATPKSRAQGAGSFSTSSQQTPPAGPPAPEPPRPLAALPPLDQVQAKILSPSEAALPLRQPAVWASRGGETGGAWKPRTWQEADRDHLVGERGEAIVHRLELERVRGLGYADPEQHVVWTSKADPAADHDIKSIDPDGQPVWIEVKSTTGIDGRFDWSQAEFVRALREGPRYILWRVYEADSDHPSAKAFRDPAARITRSALRVEISGLAGYVEGKDS